jgi:hypothetical protein
VARQHKIQRTRRLPESLTVSYEYGSLPPNFQLVDSKFSFSIVYKFKTNFPSK